MDNLSKLIVMWAIGLAAGRAIMLVVREYYNEWWRIAIGFTLFAVSIAAFIAGGLYGMGIL